jgi:4-hydroxy-tetrahydrodipicolinate synthase
VEEAAGRIVLQGSIDLANVERDVALMRTYEAIGFDSFTVVPLGHPSTVDADTLYEAFASRIRATELPVTVYAAQGRFSTYPHLGPAGQPLDVFDRVADLPNAIGIKVSHPVPLGIHWQLCEKVADRMLVAPVNLDFAPVLARNFQIQWTGQWNVEGVQGPHRQFAHELLAATADHDFARADAVYNEMYPLLEHFYWLQAPAIKRGAHPWAHNKYYSWLTGGNGGLLPLTGPGRDHVPVLDAAARQGMRDAFAAAGVAVTDAPDDEFIVGKAAWDRGVRPDAATPLPSYSRE